MDFQFTPAAAFLHFLENYKGEMSRDLYEAKYTAQGLRKHPLGARRIKRLLEKYAPGKYEFREVVIFHDKK